MHEKAENAGMELDAVMGWTRPMEEPWMEDGPAKTLNVSPG